MAFDLFVYEEELAVEREHGVEDTQEHHLCVSELCVGGERTMMQRVDIFLYTTM